MEIEYTLTEIDTSAQRVLKYIGVHTVIAFNGEMGAGKTTFINAFCKALGVKDTVTSPTFSIINQYKTISNQIVYHMDLYRLKNNEEAINAGVEDCLFSKNICLVEWAEKAPDIFPSNTVQITISLLSSNSRNMQINL